MKTKIVLFSIMSLVIMSCGSSDQNQNNDKTPAPPQSGVTENTNADEINDSILSKYAVALVNIRQLQQRRENEMIQIIEDGGLKISEYQEIKVSRSDNMKDSFTEEEVKKYNNIYEDIKDLNKKLQTEVHKELKKQNMNEARFQQIHNAIKIDSGLQKRLENKITRLTK